MSDRAESTFETLFGGYTAWQPSLAWCPKGPDDFEIDSLGGIKGKTLWKPPAACTLF